MKQRGRFGGFGGFGRPEEQMTVPDAPAPAAVPVVDPERGERPETVRAMWTESRQEVPEVTIAIPVQQERRDPSPGAGDPARAAWIRVMAGKRELDENQAAHLWDANIPLIPKGAFAEGFHSRNAELEEKTQRLTQVEESLRRTSERLASIEADLSRVSERGRSLESEIERARALLKAVAGLAGAAIEEETALDPDRMTQVAFSVLTDVSLALSGDTERRYPSRPLYIRSAAVFKKLYDEGETSEFVTLYQDLTSLLREMEPYFFAAQAAAFVGDRPDESDDEEPKPES